MNSRMKKDEFLELVKSLKISKDEFYILSSGALVIRGIFPDAGDLDIAVTKKGLDELKENYNLVRKESGFYTVTDNIECVYNSFDEDEKYPPEYIGEYKVENIFKYLEYLKSSTREKDKLRIPLVEKYIEENYR